MKIRVVELSAILLCKHSHRFVPGKRAPQTSRVEENLEEIILPHFN